MTGSEPIVVDSSGWLEYLADGSKADAFALYLEREEGVLVPTIVIYEVRKVLSLKQNKSLADIFLSDALRRTILPFDDILAIKSADISVRHKLSMADAIIYATAQHSEALLVTSDSHFEKLGGVILL